MRICFQLFDFVGSSQLSNHEQSSLFVDRVKTKAIETFWINTSWGWVTHERFAAQAVSFIHVNNDEAHVDLVDICVVSPIDKCFCTW